MKIPKGRGIDPEEHPEVKEKKSGIIYFQTIPPLFTVARMREEMLKYGDVGRIYLQVCYFIYISLFMSLPVVYHLVIFTALFEVFLLFLFLLYLRLKSVLCHFE